MSINSINFTSRYKLNANQPMKSEEACLKRDCMIGMYSQMAKNGKEVQKQMDDFYKNVYDKNPNARLDIVLELPDNMNKDFEAGMKEIGQSFIA